MFEFVEKPMAHVERHAGLAVEWLFQSHRRTGEAPSPRGSDLNIERPDLFAVDMLRVDLLGRMEGQHLGATEPQPAAILFAVGAAANEAEISVLMEMARQAGAGRMARFTQRDPRTRLPADDFPQKIAECQTLIHCGS